MRIYFFFGEFVFFSRFFSTKILRRMVTWLLFKIYASFCGVCRSFELTSDSLNFPSYLPCLEFSQENLAFDNQVNTTISYLLRHVPQENYQVRYKFKKKIKLYREFWVADYGAENFDSWTLGLLNIVLKNSLYQAWLVPKSCQLSYDFEEQSVVGNLDLASWDPVKKSADVCLIFQKSLDFQPPKIEFTKVTSGKIAGNWWKKENKKRLEIWKPVISVVPTTLFVILWENLLALLVVYGWFTSRSRRYA